MAKPPRARRSGGGRVTPKGTQPNGRSTRAADAPHTHRSGPRRLDPPKAAPGRGTHVPPRAGHHRGQR